MTVVVVNCSNWHTFPPLVRTRALDLYPPQNRVKFWHAAAPQFESDIRLWGGWPKCFAEPLWILRDELEDLVSSHITSVSETMDDVAIEPLTIIVVLEAGSLSQRGYAARLATVTVQNAMKAIALRLASENTDKAKILRSLWRIAVLHERHGARDPGRDKVIAEARKLTADPVPIDKAQGTGLISIFDTAVVLDGGVSDEASFASLRVLIDMARDSRVRGALKPGVVRAAPRVIRLEAPRIRENPSDRILIDLDLMVREYDPSPERDEGADPLKKPMEDLKHRVMQSDEHFLSRAAEATVARSTPDPQIETGLREIEDRLRRYFTDNPPTLSELKRQGDLKRVVEILEGARNGLEPFLAERHVRLQEMRKAHDKSMRPGHPLLQNFEIAATDRSFAQSGRVLVAIENGLDGLKKLQKDYIVRAEQCRLDLNDEYRIELATARSKRRDKPRLSDFDEVGEFDRATKQLMYWFANSAASRRFLWAWLVFIGFYGFAFALVLTIAHPGKWTWSMVWPAASLLFPALISALWLFLRWNWIRKKRTLAITKAEESYAAAVGHINRVTRLALAHLASSWVAGRLEPFARLLNYRGRDLLELRTTATRVFGIIRRDRKQIATASGERKSREATIENKLQDVDPQDTLKVALSSITAVKPADIPIVSSGGEMTGELVMSTALVLDTPVSLSFVLEVESSPISPDPMPPRKSKRGKRSDN
jgi:hypothetical protein